MDTDKAIMAFSQSEKLKAGIIWVSQSLNLFEGLSDAEKKGAEKIISTLLNMVAHEANVAKAVAGVEGWEEIGPHIDKAIMMVNSGVGQEANIHLSKALSKITNIGQQSMSVLKEEGLIP